MGRLISGVGLGVWLLLFCTPTVSLAKGLEQMTECGKVTAINNAEVHIRSGTIRGERLEIPSLANENYHVFRGIPYAAPPVGALRFARPEEPAKWLGVQKTLSFKRDCFQNFESMRNTSHGAYGKQRERDEDCLFLNVFAPEKSLGNDTFPVIFFIHGGGYQMGSAADYRCEPILRHFVSRRVIFVTANYRLGPLGFASTGDELALGNNGLWDLLMALKWVKENIHLFHGDPHRVTMMGHGSGASAASLLALSPRVENYFRNVILLSGNALTPGAVRTTAVNATLNLQEYLKCEAANSSQILECLRSKPVQQLYDSNVPRVFYDDYQEWVPMVDGYGELIPEDLETLATYRPRTPILLGTTRDESALHLMILGKDGVNISGLTKDLAERIVRNLTSEYYGFINHQLITEGSTYEYIQTRTNPQTQSDVLKSGILDLYSHFWYHAPASRMANYYKINSQDAYLYSYDHEHSAVSPSGNEWRGAFHGADLTLLFDIPASFLESSNVDNSRWQINRRVAEVFADLITNFAKYNNATPPESDYEVWQPFDPPKLNFYSITDMPRNDVGFHYRGHIFWNQYARHLDAVDVGNLRYISSLKSELGDYQMATWVLLSCALFFFSILVGLACYCTRKDGDEDDM